MFLKKKNKLDEVKKELFNGIKSCDLFENEESINEENLVKIPWWESFVRCGSDGTWKPLLFTHFILAIFGLYKLISIYWNALYAIHLSVLWSGFQNMTDKTGNSVIADFMGFLFGLLSFNVLKALILGLAVSIFTWMIIYMDSLEPGYWPPSPLSPSKYRKLSGHTFHMGYIMAIANGLIVFGLALWW